MMARAWWLSFGRVRAKIYCIQLKVAAYYPTLWALSSLSSRDKLYSSSCCMQDAFSLVYKIPYRRARAWPSGLMPSARASKNILRIRNLTRRVVYKAECAREQRYLAYKGNNKLKITSINDINGDRR